MKGTGTSQHSSKKTATKCDKTLASALVNTVGNGENIYFKRKEGQETLPRTTDMC